MSKIEVKRNKNTRIHGIDFKNLGFGKYFSDHIYLAKYENGKWQPGQILPYEAIPYEPGMMTLHYGQTIFEGLKAYKDFKNGGVNIFRPDMNAKRMVRSANKVCIEPYPEEDFINALKKIVEVDNKFIPNERGQSLYLRPLAFGDGNFLGVHKSETYSFMIMTSPVASYYPEGLKPVKILVSHEFARTVEGGLGDAKTAANYAASLYAGEMAKKQGYNQVLWLDGKHREYVDEVGAMNIMFVINGEIVTPPLDTGTILAGVTRNTVIHLAKQWGLKVNERRIKIDEVFEAHKKGELQEVFGTGTAATVSPVGILSYKDETIEINNGKIGPIAQKLYDTITGIQHGDIEDTNNWNIHLDVFEEASIVA